VNTVLRYGDGQSIDLDFPEGVLLAACEVPRGTPLDDTRKAVGVALDLPVGFPPLARGTTPGDHVVLALDRDVPEAASIVAAMIDYLLQAGVEAEGISVLVAKNDAQATTLRADWPAEWTSHVSWVEHNPADARRLAYLARSESGESVFLNRVLNEADVVLPIGVFRRRTAAGSFGVHGAIFPTFANQSAVQRFRGPDALRRRGRHTAHFVQEAAEVSWLLGVTFTVQVVPAGGHRAMAVLAGDPAAVETRGRELYDAAWHCEVPGRAALVVASLEGGPAEQTWENLGRAVAAAAPLAAEGGAIVLCTALAAEPGPGMQFLSEVADPDDAWRRIRKDKPDDILPATQLIRALRQAKVYLLSDLDPGLVEQLNMVPLSSPDDLHRLVHRSRSSIVLPSAPHASVKLCAENGETD
jgi:nickel-dependent lactate racemase